jgi:hypothetical protein
MAPGETALVHRAQGRFVRPIANASASTVLHHGGKLAFRYPPILIFTTRPLPSWPSVVTLRLM